MGGTILLTTPVLSASGGGFRTLERKCQQVMRVHMILIIAVLWIFHPGYGQLLQPDSRCFLENGGSTLTFFIKEDLNVGEAIGRLNIQGRVGRDIDLTIEDLNGLYVGQDIPVELGTSF